MEMVAILACVTRSSVSYYYWGRLNEISPATQSRIRDAAKEIGYEPYDDDEWYETFGREILKGKGYDPDEIRTRLRSVH